MPEQNPLETGVMPLDKGAAAYVLIDVPDAKPVIEKLSYIPMNDKNIKQMIDKTRSAALAVFMPSSGETRRFQLVSWGGYPASGSGIVFGSNREWKKRRSAFMNTVYWHSEKAQMSVAVFPALAYVSTAITKDPHDPIPSPEGVKIPDGFGEFGRNAVLSCWLSDPGSVFSQKLRETGIPLEIPAENLFIRLLPADGQASATGPASASRTAYEAQIKIIMSGAAQARALANLINIARLFLPATDAGEDADNAQKSAAMMSYLLFTNPVIQEDNSLLIKTPQLSVNEIALLFSMFSL